MVVVAATPNTSSAVGRHKGITRDHVIEAALGAFAREGPTASMDSIAAALGIRKSSLFSHVRSKEELHGLVSEHVAQKIARAIDGPQAAERLLDHFIAEPRHARFLAFELLSGNHIFATSLRKIADTEHLACTALAVLLTLACGADEESVRKQLRRLLAS